MTLLKILATIGIIAVIALLQLVENQVMGNETPREIGLFGWVKTGFIVYLIWFWVDNSIVA